MEHTSSKVKTPHFSCPLLTCAELNAFEFRNMNFYSSVDFWDQNNPMDISLVESKVIYSNATQMVTLR